MRTLYEARLIVYNECADAPREASIGAVSRQDAVLLLC